MSASTEAVSILDLNGAATNCTPKITKRCRLGADASPANLNLYVHLTTDNRIFVGSKPSGRMLEVTMASSPWGSNQVTFNGIECFTMPVYQTDPSYLALYVLGAYEASGDPASTFVVVLPLKGMVLTSNFSVETPVVYNPMGALGASAVPATIQQDVCGLHGSEYPNNMYGMGMAMGWYSIKFTGAGDANAAMDEYESVAETLMWRMERPRLTPVTVSDNGRPPRMSLMNLSIDEFSLGSRIRSLIPVRDYVTGGCRLVTALVDYDPALSTYILRLEECVTDMHVISLSDNDYTTFPLIQGGAVTDPHSDPLRLFLKTNTPSAFAIGWGFNVPAPTEPYSPGLIGLPMLAVGGTGYFRMFGGVNASYTFATSTADLPWVDKIVCGYNGAIEDPAMQYATGYPNLSRGKIVLVSGKCLYASDTGADFGEATRVLTLPSYDLPDEASKGLYAISMDVRCYDEVAAPGYFGSRWYALATYVDSATGHMMVVMYDSPDGAVWSVGYSADCTALTQQAFFDLYAVTASSCNKGRQQNVGDVSVALLGSSMHLALVGMEAYHSSVGTKYFEVKVSLTSTTGEYASQVYPATLGTEGSYHPATQSSCETGNSALYVLSGNGKCIRQFEPADGAATLVLGTASPIHTPAGWSSEDNPPSSLDWNQDSGVFNPDVVTDGLYYVGYTAGTMPLLFKEIADSEPLYFLSPIMESSPITPLSAVENVGFKLSVVSGYSMADYTVAYTFSSVVHGTMVFLRGPDGKVGHVQMSSLAAQGTFDLPVAVGGTRLGVGKQFYSLGTTLSDIYEHTADGVTSLYLVTSGGIILKLSDTDSSFAVASASLAGYSNVRLARVDTVWVATHGTLFTGIMTSPDMATWSQALAEGDGVGPLESVVRDIIPMGSAPARIFVMPGATEYPSIFLPPQG